MPYIFFNSRKEMKKTLILLTVLFSIGFSKDFIKLGNEAYDKNNYQKAAEFYQKACDGGIASGCATSGVLYADGKGVRQDYQKAAEFLKKGCDGGDAMGCFNLGYLYAGGKGVRQDYQKAAELLKKSCDGGDAKDCTNLGVLYAEGNEIRQDYQKAAELLKKGCDGGYAMGCGNLGIVYAKQRNYSTAKEYYGKACDLNLPLACDRYKELNEKGY